MQYKEIEIKLPTKFTAQDLRKVISKKLHVKQFNYEILLQSLDARHKPDVYWVLRVRVMSKEINGESYNSDPGLVIPYRKRDRKVIIVGSGPAGFFAGFVLQKAGFKVTILEKGPKVGQRYQDIISFESGGEFKDNSNYCHGEGGAGTFSDGKLTSRTKGIAIEKQFIFDSYAHAGAPEEIRYLAKPHIGSDRLRIVIPNLRKQFESLGGKMLFETEVSCLVIKDKKCRAVVAGNDEILCDMLILAPGHSSYKTYRMLHQHGILFRSKPFAIGVRVEHPQELINTSQWNTATLPGLKAAEYKLTHTASSGLPVYSFCMCPGGKVIPSAPADMQNIVNGVSDYARNSTFANSAIVAGIDLNKILGKDVGFVEALAWLENLEKRVFDLTGSYKIPGQRIADFLGQKISSSIPSNSYPFEVFPYNFEDLFPVAITRSLREGMTDFSRKIKGFESGLMMGLESKTSSPVQVIRNEHRRCEGFDNIFIVGEGSGYAGGITSSAVDGVKLGIDLTNG
ncbi:MAG: NAD(P)/FAD-dependent oxidoreductase [Bacteroidales bacterium]|nr:NAD(P)/FAD-dependent oxidoreductase [Bacteroidales bacterium]